MKIWLTSDNVSWDTPRYRYPAEQMLLTLFPGERPEYPEAPIPKALYAEHNAAVLTLIENLHRQDLNCFEEAEGIYALMKESGLSQQKICRRSRSTTPCPTR